MGQLQLDLRLSETPDRTSVGEDAMTDWRNTISGLPCSTGDKGTMTYFNPFLDGLETFTGVCTSVYGDHLRFFTEDGTIKAVKVKEIQDWVPSPDDYDSECDLACRTGIIGDVRRTLDK